MRPAGHGRPPWPSPVWRACEEPEREPDAYVSWHYDDCRPCRIKAEVQAARYPDDPHVAWLLRRMGGDVPA